MKKTVTINISGTVYHIDEDAYQVLQGYLLTLENHFKHDSSSDEIMSDIESRISELLQMKIKSPYQVISIDDVHEIIKIMGTPEDFGIHSNQEHSQNGNNRSTKRLFRDEDNRVIGGVCSGIAYYFNVDVVLIRLAAILSFFFAGPLLYLIAWVVIPKAETTQQKVYMRGEKVDIESIKQRVREGFEDVKRDTTHFVRNTWNNNRASSFFVELGGHLLRAVLAFTVIICLAIFVALFAGFSFQWVDFSNFAQVFPQTFQSIFYSLFSNPTQANFAVGGVILLVCLPILLLLWGIFSLLLGFRKNSKIWGYIILVIWLAGLFMLGLSVYKIVKDFDYKHAEKQVYSIKPQINREFIIYQSGFQNLENCTYVPADVKQVKHWAFIECEDNLRTACIVKMEVKHSFQDSITVEVFETSRGKDGIDARKRTQEITVVPQLTDSTLRISKYVVLPQKQQWRKQKIDVVVTLPKGLNHIVVDEGNIE